MEEIETKKALLQNKIVALNNHKLLKTDKLNNAEAMKIFMEHHVYAVWDFMSILKSLQHYICPSNYPWKPNLYTKNGIARLINEIVLAEESDEVIENQFISHFDLYIEAMEDFGANTSQIKNLMKTEINKDLRFIDLDIPECSKDFISTTYELLSKNKLHINAALFTYGRETTLPNMFINILKIIEHSKKIDKLKLYLKRHVDIDSNRHGPLAIKLYELSVKNDLMKINESLDAAIIAIDSRTNLWSGIYKAIKNI